MSGIIYPNNWSDIIINNKVLAKSNIVSTRTLLNELQLRLIKSICYFNSQPFCLALSGGIDSSILATLLVKHKYQFTAVTIGSNDKHPDIVHAKILQKKLKFKHKILIFSKKRKSADAYEDLFHTINDFGFRNVICADTIDEMLGGYWMHQKPEVFCDRFTPNALEWTFEYFWKELLGGHLCPMDTFSKIFSIQVVLPYLAAHELIRNIAMSQRVDSIRRKIILRDVAEEIGVPEEIINRPKLGLCSIWDTKF